MEQIPQSTVMAMQVMPKGGASLLQGEHMKNSGSMSHKYAYPGSKSRSATGYVEQAFQYLLIQVVLGDKFVIHASQQYCI